MAVSAVANASRTGSRLATWAKGLVVAAVALLGTPALAQPTAEQIAQRAIEKIHRISTETVDREAAAALRAVERIEELDANNAPDHVIIAFGHRAVEALQRLGQAGRTNINNTTRNAVQALNRLNAPPALIESVENAAREGRASINAAQQRAVGAVREAVDEATGPG